jgi:7-carboxy-7-deazaguanine synthase (Cx14CxxC type)
MTFAVKEIFHTLQGEGARAGSVAVFCRFTGCNLWSGREDDRAGAVCRFCDTDFVGTDGPGGGKFESAASLASAVRAAWNAPWPARGRPLLVCTGGEPLLQLDADLVRAFHGEGFEVAVETNGTRALPEGVDWVTVSPKGDVPLAVTGGDEIKLVFPQAGVDPVSFEGLPFRHFFLQPMDGPEQAGNTRLAARYCLEHPAWRLSIQMHKVVGLP